MKKKEYLGKNYKEFQDFIATVAANELEYFVLSANFTSYFNTKMKELVDEVEKRSNLAGLTSVGIMFNTKGEVTIIDAHIIGRFIADRYEAVITNYYRSDSLNRIIYSIVNGSEKAKKAFVKVTYEVLTTTLKELYMDIKYKKEVAAHYGQRPAIDIISLLILEDICIYLGICDEYINELMQ